MGRSRDSGYQVPVWSTPVRLPGCNGLDYEYVLYSERRISYRVGPALFRCLQFLWEPHHLKPLYPHNEKPSFSKASSSATFANAFYRQRIPWVSSLPYLSSRCLLGLLSYLTTAFTGSGLACVMRKTSRLAWQGKSCPWLSSFLPARDGSKNKTRRRNGMRKESTKLPSRRISYYYRHCQLLDYSTTCRYQFDSISGTTSYCGNSLPSVVLLSADPPY